MTELRCYVCGGVVERAELELIQSPETADSRELVCVWCAYEDD